MRSALFVLLLVVAGIPASVRPALAADDAAPLLDALTFGDAGDEQAHLLAAERSEVIRGGLAQPARHLLPRAPVSFAGGTLTFTLKVDPQALNYFTLKLWGSDRGARSGRLILLSGDKQIGYRHEGDYDVLNQIEDDPSYPGRFVYATVPLPPALTQGRQQLALTIASLGPMWPYGTTFEQYQKTLTQPTRGLYRAYTHTTPRFVPPPAEPQGQAAPAPVRPGPGEEVLEQARARVIEALQRLPDGATSDRGDPLNVARARSSTLLLLAEAYTTPWAGVFHDERLLQRILREGDAFVRDQARDPRFVTRDWQGAGALGEALLKVYEPLAKAMAEPIDDDDKPETPPVPRRQAWARLLLTSREFWRTHRRAFTNQSMIVDRNIYTANRGLQLLDPEQAFPEAKARRYLYEATGIDPWLGSDTPDGASERPYGSSYRLVTRKGLTRELGYVGTYGETIFRFTLDMARLSGDAKLRDQLRKLQAARAPFRYPSVDSEGYRAMRLASPIDNRTAHYPSGTAYATAEVRENWGLEVAAFLKDEPVAVGMAQQCLEDNQYFVRLQRRLNEPDILGLMRAVDDYQTVKGLPKSAYRLPMTEGQGDFAWADEDAGVLALRRGEERLFVNLYYRSERGVNGVARVHELSPRIERLATVRTQYELEPSGQEYVRPDWIDGIRNRGLPPPGVELHQAWAGEKLPIAARPADAKLPKYGDWGPFVGKASFYRVQYGDYLIGMNCSGERTYDLPVPPGRTEAPELNSGKVLALAGAVKVPPLSTVVLYLGR